MSSTAPPPPGFRWLAPALAASATLAAAMALTWPLPLDFDLAIPRGFFHGGHVWVFDHVARMVSGDLPLSTLTERMGLPTPVEIRPIALGPALVAAPLRALWGPVAAYVVVLWLAFPASALAAYALLRRLEAAPMCAAAAATTYALCPFALGALASGQTAKIQLWAPALLLLCWVSAVQGRWWGVLLAPAAATVLAFTDPTLTLFVPLAGAALLPWLWVHALRQGRRPAILGSIGLAVALAASAPVFLAARGFYTPDLPKADQAFVPAVRMAGIARDLSPVATLAELFWAPAEPARYGWRTVTHVAFLGVPMLLAALVLLPRAATRAPGASLALLGGILALGPILTGAEGAVLVQGQALRLPAALLDHLDYPTAKSGMYYRAAYVGSLGLALLVASGASRLRWGGALAWLVAIAQFAFVIHMTRWMWPIPVQPVLGGELALEMAHDPDQGGVLALPVRVDDGTGSIYLLTAAVHGRPTSALPRSGLRSERSNQNLAVLARALETGGRPGQLLLLRHGLRYLTWLDSAEGGPDEPGPDAISALLGPPRIEGELSVWRVP